MAAGSVREGDVGLGAEASVNSMTRTEPTTAGLEAERGLKAKECWEPLEAGKDKGRDFPLELPERMQACQYCDFCPVKLMSDC